MLINKNPVLMNQRRFFIFACFVFSADNFFFFLPLFLPFFLASFFPFSGCFVPAPILLAASSVPEVLLNIAFHFQLIVPAAVLLCDVKLSLLSNRCREN
ncbi:MAG: hypothetical protein CMI13_04070 [Oleibacter sp.]|nr:hypothetical protein [Thalassolituus sp.]